MGSNPVRVIDFIKKSIWIIIWSYDLKLYSGVVYGFDSQIKP